MKVILVMVWVGFADLECGFGCVFIFIIIIIIFNTGYWFDLQLLKNILIDFCFDTKFDVRQPHIRTVRIKSNVTLLEVNTWGWLELAPSHEEIPQNYYSKAVCQLSIKSS